MGSMAINKYFNLKIAYDNSVQMQNLQTAFTLISYGNVTWLSLYADLHSLNKDFPVICRDA